MPNVFCPRFTPFGVPAPGGDFLFVLVLTDEFDYLVAFFLADIFSLIIQQYVDAQIGELRVYVFVGFLDCHVTSSPNLCAII